MNRPPVVHLSTVHRPTDVRIFEKEARTLAQAGYPVTVIAPATEDTEQEGIMLRALRGPHRGPARFTQTNPEAFRVALTYPKETIFHVHDPELLFTAFALKRRGYRVVYDVHEDTPVWIQYQTWIPAVLRPALSRLFAYLERRATRLLDGVIVVTPPMYQRLQGPRTILLRNLPRKARFEQEPWREMPYRSRPFQLFYAGGLTELRGIREMLDALARLNAWRPVTLVLAGAFYPSELEAWARQHPAWRHVRFLGWQPPDVLRSHLTRSRVGLALLHPVGPYRRAYPTKVFEYMAAGLPFVASDLPLLRPLVEGAGHLVDPYDPQAVVTVVRYLLEHSEEAEAMGRTGRSRFLDELNWERESRHLLELYDRIAQRPVA